MLELKFIRANPDAVRNDLRKRGDAEKLEWLEDLQKLDAKSRDLNIALDKMRNRRNVISREINEAKKAGKDAEDLLKEAAGLPLLIKANEKELDGLIDKMTYYLMRLPNVMHESVPEGKDDSENKEVRRWGETNTRDWELRAHGELAAEKGWCDFERAAKVSGAGFVFIKGNLALLDLALQRFALDRLVAKGYTPCEVPLMLNRGPYEGVTDLSDFEKVMYKVEGEDAYLIATSEHPMGAMYQNEILEEKDLPVRLAGISACFRKEIGAHGVDTKGLFRMHQFNKVEQFVFCKPEDSWKFHEEILSNAEEIFRELEIPYRVVAICTGDIGTVAAKKYDIEAWMPREKTYKEVVSCSNCTSYQAVRLNIKYRFAHDFERKEHVHTLNSTAVATSRAMRAILENCQRQDGSVEVPKVLRPYMNGLDEL